VYYDVWNLLRIVRYKMYLKYITGGRNAKKKYIKFKIKHEIFKINFDFFPLFPVVKN